MRSCGTSTRLTPLKLKSRSPDLSQRFEAVIRELLSQHRQPSARELLDLVERKLANPPSLRARIATIFGR